MLRATFFSIGLFVLMLGASFLLVDKFVLNIKTTAMKEQPRSGFRGLLGPSAPVAVEKPSEFNPPDWAAFTLLSIGSVTMLYSVALPKKKQEHH